MASITHTLQQIEPGMVWLDPDNRITAMNAVAKDLLGTVPGLAIGEDVMALHPEASRDKVKWLIDHTPSHSADNRPITMMINTPERVLLIKVAKMMGAEAVLGTCMVFFDVTAEAMRPGPKAKTGAETGNELWKLPVYKHNQILLLDLDDVACIKADGRYSTLYTAEEEFFCSLSLAELERRLTGDRFIRAHRSYLVNLGAALAFEKEDDSPHLVMRHGDGLRVPISRNRVADIKTRFGLG